MLSNSIQYTILVLLFISLSISNSQILIETTSVLPDKHLENAIMRLLSQDSKYSYSTIKTLNANSLGIRNLTGIDKCINLEVLDLSNNYIRNVTPLKNLKSLKRLYISHNYISDITPLTNLRNLDILELNYNHIDDIQCISKFQNLREIRLVGNLVDNIRLPFNEIRNLERIYLNSNSITNISCDSFLKYTGATELTIDLSGNMIDTEVIDACTNLLENTNVNIVHVPSMHMSNTFDNGCRNKLIIDSKAINHDFSLISNHEVTQLEIYNYEGNSLGLLKRLPNLNELIISTHTLDSLPGLEMLPSLTYLKITGYKINNLANISKLENLELLNIHLCPYLDKIDFLTTLNKLEKLYLTGLGRNCNFSQLSDLENLTDLLVRYSNFEDIESINNLKHLNNLQLYGNKINDLSGLDAEYKLVYLSLSDNYIEDFNALLISNCFSENGHLYLYNNPLSDESIYESIPYLESRGVKVYYDKPDDYDPSRIKLPDETNS